MRGVTMYQKITLSLDAASSQVVPAHDLDGLSAQADFSNGGSSGVVEILLNYTGRTGDGVSMSGPQTMTAASPRVSGLDIIEAPFVEYRVTTAAAGEYVSIHHYAYRALNWPTWA